MDILVNNAGAAWGSPAEDHPVDAWDKVMNLNVRGYFILSQHIAKHSMIARKQGSIINVASIAGLGGNPSGMNTIAYNTSKGAVINFTRALAAASGATGVWAWHLVFKPAAITITIIFVASNAYQSSARGQFHYKSWGLLLAALLASLAGDVFLMLEGLFIPGLVSFLLAHLAYIALLGRSVRWFAHRGALLLTVAVGAAMYAWLWQGGLPAELRAPVAVYVLVIALMAAQALGRAAQLQTDASRTVALGACIFMLSDSVLAVDRFVQPVPLALLWVLATYYAAQFCIVHGMVQELRTARS